jgi:hypothetical protein
MTLHFSIGPIRMSVSAYVPQIPIRSYRPLPRSLAALTKRNLYRRIRSELSLPRASHAG